MVMVLDMVIPKDTVTHMVVTIIVQDITKDTAIRAGLMGITQRNKVLLLQLVRSEM